MARTRFERLHLVLQAILMVAILVTVNVIAMRHFSRLDFTGGRRYSLAPSTRLLLDRLPDMLTVRVYFSRDLPPYLTGLREEVRDLLEEYGAWAGKNLQVEFVTPETDPATEAKMKMVGIPLVELNIVQKEQFQVTKVYMGLAIFYADRKETIPVIQDLSELEYRLTGAIVRITRDKPVTVGFAEGAGGGAAGYSGKYGLVLREVRRQYEVAMETMGGDRPIPPEISTLILAGPRELADRDLYHLDRFVARGGKLVILADGVELGDGLEGNAVQHRLDRLLAAWGLKLSPQAVFDAQQNALATFSNGQFRFQIHYPYWPMVSRSGLDVAHPITAQIDGLVLPWSSPLNLSGPGPRGVTRTVLARSSEGAWAVDAPMDLTPNRALPKYQGVTGTKNLAVLLTGVLPSAFADGKLPEGLTAEERQGPGSAAPSAVLLVGNARFIEDSFAEQFPGNAAFLLNAVDWMAMGSDLIGIRSRQMTDRPLREMAPRAKMLIRLVNIFAVSLILAVIGIIRFITRYRMTRRAD